ncbi:MAG TPA: DNA repair protein RadA [Anaerolineales bacterium]|nr:DNA repair protein RadA [Anaerolineales bacterium]
MSKIRTQYVCQNCGRTAPRPMGKCPGCGEFNSMVEETVAAPAKVVNARAGGMVRIGGGRATPQKLSDVEGMADARWPVPIRELSRVLGGGVVPGSIVLIGGDPGIGKSTLLLQMTLHMVATIGPVLYVSGEESERQIKMRADRLAAEAGEGTGLSAAAGSEQLFVLTETNLDVILEHVQQVKPQLLVIDSIQTVYLAGLESTAGSVSQVRECAARLQELAKTSGIAVFLIGHVTKEGTLAGPRVLEHIVDTVLQLEGDRYQAYRLLRAAKNRFGATSEVGVFEMAGSGLLEVTNPSEVFLAERMVNVPGSAIAVTMEGTRPILVEVQGLTSPNQMGNPRRTPNGADLYRLLMIIAVLGRRAGVRLGENDVFVNVVGGLKIDEPAADLAVAAAIASSALDRAVLADCVLVGEIGLSGELRAVGQLGQRLREAHQLGFRRAIVPRALRKSVDKWPEGLEVIQCRSVRDALEKVLVPARKGEE